MRVASNLAFPGDLRELAPWRTSQSCGMMECLDCTRRGVWCGDALQRCPGRPCPGRGAAAVQGPYVQVVVERLQRERDVQNERQQHKADQEGEALLNREVANRHNATRFTRQ